MTHWVIYDGGGQLRRDEELYKWAGRWSFELWARLEDDFVLNLIANKVKGASHNNKRGSPSSSSVVAAADGRQCGGWLCSEDNHLFAAPATAVD